MLRLVDCTSTLVRNNYAGTNLSIEFELKISTFSLLFIPGGIKNLKNEGILGCTIGVQGNDVFGESNIYFWTIFRI